MPDRLEVVVFDVLETLLNLDPLAARLENVGQPAAADVTGESLDEAADELHTLR